MSQTVVACAACGTALPPAAKFCPECAHPVAPSLLASGRQELRSRLASTSSSLEGERKFVTVLFADLKGSMELFAGRDPEEARRLLDPVLEHMCHAVEMHGGTVSQVMGDGIMALFGAPVASEDHAARACYAGFTMQDLVRHYGDEIQRTHGVPLQIRVGLNSGEAVLSLSGHGLHMSYTAIGLTVHIASRMEQMAKPGSVLATADTVHLARGGIDARALGPVRIKGFDRPIEVAEITRPTATRFRFGAAPARSATRFVGRQAELACLLEAFAGVRGGGPGRLVAVVGDAGIGKSRLVREFLSALPEGQVLALDGGAAPYGSGAGYRPGIHIVRQYFQLGDDDEPAAVRERVAGKVVTLGGGATSVAAPLLFLLRVLPSDNPFHALPLEERRFRVFDALMWLVRRITVEHPLVLAYEDMQWVTSDTHDFLQALAANLPRSTLVILSYRTEFDGRSLQKPGCVELRLEGLADEATGAIIQDLLGDDPSLQGVAEALQQRSGGNPLFIEEHIRSMVEAGQIEGEPRNYRKGPRDSTFAIPPSIQAVLAARIDRLERQDKHVLQAVAAIGASASLRLLERVLSSSPEELARSLRRLQTAGLLIERTDPDHLIYEFKHALTQTVAYDSLLHGRRRDLHARILAALENSDDFEVLARHAVLAEAWERAVQWLRVAGKTAAAHFAGLEAVAYFERAIDILRRLPATASLREIAIDLRFELRNALVPLGRHEQILETLQAAKTMASEMNDRRRLAQTLCYLSNYHGNVGRSDLALQAAEESLALGLEVGASDLIIVGHLVAGEIRRTLGDYALARDYLERVIGLLGDLHDGDRLGQVGLPSVRARSHLAWTLAELGEFAAAPTAAENGLRIADKVRQAFSISHACLGLGGTLLRQGEFAAAIPVLTRGFASSERVPLLRPPLAADLGLACASTGDLERGLAHAQAAVEDARAMGRLSRLPLILVKCGEIHLLAGHSQRALSLGAAALSLALEQKERGNEVHANLLLADVYARVEPRPQLVEGERYYRVALTQALALGMKPLAAHAHVGLGRLDLAKGQGEQARAPATGGAPVPADGYALLDREAGTRASRRRTRL